MHNPSKIPEIIAVLYTSLNNCINIMDAEDVEITENTFISIPVEHQFFVDTFNRNVHIHNNQSLNNNSK